MNCQLSIYEATPLVPYIIAEKAIWNYFKEQGKDDPATIYPLFEPLTTLLCDKAERIFSCNEHFRKELMSKKKDPRQVLEMFMRHWLGSMIKQLSTNRTKKIPCGHLQPKT